MEVMKIGTMLELSQEIHNDKETLVIKGLATDSHRPFFIEEEAAPEEDSGFIQTAVGIRLSRDTATKLALNILDLLK